MTLTVLYFARLRVERGLSSETVDSAARTPRQLYDELADRHGFSLDAQHLRVAVNEEFADWQAPLADGDTVVFLQPAAGG